MSRASLRLYLCLCLCLCARCGGPEDPTPQQMPADTVRAELVASGTSARLNGISGTGGADIWVVGEAGTILHHDGSGFSRVESGTAAELRSVAARDPADAWAVGVQAALRYDGQAWRSAGYLGADQRTDETYNAVLALSAEDTWVGGNVAGRRSQQRWKSAYQRQWRHEFHALHALTGHMWIAGDRGVLLHAPRQGGEVGTRSGSWGSRAWCCAGGRAPGAW
jgi:hypothetical protein